MGGKVDWPALDVVAALLGVQDIDAWVSSMLIIREMLSVAT